MFLCLFTFVDTTSKEETEREIKKKIIIKMITDFYDTKEANIIKLETKDGKTVGIIKKDLDNITKDTFMFTINEKTGVVEEKTKI